MIERKLVIEHRITRIINRSTDRSVRPQLTVRFWIESDPKHDGVSQAAAVILVDNAMRDHAARLLYYTEEGLVRYFLKQVPCANSVEVCEKDGDGTAGHRNWP